MVAKYCPHCGAKVSPEDKYCFDCGDSLRKSSTKHSHSQSKASTNQAPRQNRRKRPVQQSKESSSKRRDFVISILVTLGLVGVGLGAIGYLTRERPEDIAEEFIEHIDNGNMTAANELVHSDATVDGAGVLADALFRSMNLDLALQAVDITVVHSTSEEYDERAIATLRLNIDAGIEDTEGNVDIELRDEEGDWRVWGI